MKQISFKMRIALFTGIIVLITSLSLTLVSMYNAKKQIDLVVSFKTPAEENADVTYTVPASFFPK